MALDSAIHASKKKGVPKRCGKEGCKKYIPKAGFKDQDKKFCNACYNKKQKLQNGDITKKGFRNKYKKCGCGRERRNNTFKEIDGIKICKVCQNKDKKKKNS